MPISAPVEKKRIKNTTEMLLLPSGAWHLSVFQGDGIINAGSS